MARIERDAPVAFKLAIPARLAVDGLTRTLRGRRTRILLLLLGRLLLRGGWDGRGVRATLLHPRLERDGIGGVIAIGRGRGRGRRRHVRIWRALVMIIASRSWEREESRGKNTAAWVCRDRGRGVRGFPRVCVRRRRLGRERSECSRRTLLVVQGRPLRCGGGRGRGG